MKSSVRIKGGSEGPTHDPYAYHEITVTRQDGRWARIHLGLAEWMQYYDGHNHHRFDGDCLDDKFEECIGITVRKAEKVPQELFNRRLKAHHKHETEWCNGYSGEELLWCHTCGTAITTHFNRSVVE